MKKIFSNRILDWVLAGTSLLFVVLTTWNIVNDFEYLSTYLVRIAFFLTSILAFFSLLIFRTKAERFLRIFILVNLIFPAIFTFNLFVTDFVFYSALRTDLLRSPLLFIQFLAGIILFYLTLIYSRQQKKERIKDYGILIIGIGVFIICYVYTRTVEASFYPELNAYPIWKTVAKSVITIGVILMGSRVNNEKVKLKKGLIWTIVLLFINGLI